jgi:hypothetical protein
MKINHIEAIDPKKGDYIILVDYHTEGIRVYGQYKTLEDAIMNLGNSQGSPDAIVRLVEFNITAIESA